MATPKEIADILNISMLQAIVKYGGGRVASFGGVKTKTKGTTKGITAKETILHSHFTSANKGMYKPLKPKYKAFKFKKVGDKPILVFTGKMEKSIVGKTKIFHTKTEKFILTFPNAVKYAKYHAQGSALSKGGLPKRHPTALTNKDKALFDQNLTKIIASNLNALTKGVSETRHKT